MAKSRKDGTGAMQERDLAEAVDLYRTIGLGALRRPLDEVTDKLRTMMLLQPGFGPDDPKSLAHRGADGSLVGFMGVVPRRWKIGDDVVIGATTTGLVVRREHPEALVSALWLGRGGVRQGQAFSFVDRPTPGVVEIFAKLGAEVFPGHGYNFRMPLRAHDETRLRLREHVRYRRWWPAVSSIDRAARAVASHFDERTPPTLPDDDRTLTLEPATAQSLYETRLSLAEYYSPCLVDDEALAQWQFDYMATYTSRGRFRWFIARVKGKAVGWMLYYVRDDQPSEVASVVALPKHKKAVATALVRATLQDGCTSLIGTIGGAIAHELLDLGAVIESGDRIQIQSKNPAIMDAFRSNRALITGLEGEVWV